MTTFKLYKNPRFPGMDGLFFWLLLFIVIYFLLSCSKSELSEPQRIFDKYELIIDWYTLDTILSKRTIWWKHDSVWKQEMKTMLDTTADKWELICVPLHIDHIYYLKNGKKIQPSNYPKN